MKKTTSILMVDDDPAILEIYSKILRTDGYEVWKASTGREGLLATRERRPDLVLLDVILPDLGGMEVCRQIKTDPDLKDVFVVLVSGLATDVTCKVDGLEAGADDYLAKTLAAAEFLARVRTMVRLQETAAALRASEQHHRRLLEILPNAVVQFDLQVRLIGVNPRAVAMLGYANASELFQKSAFDLTRPEDHERIRADIATTLAKGTLHDAGYTLLKKDGQRFPVELSATVSTDTAGRPAGFVAIARDVSERKRFEAALTGSVRALRDNMLFLQTLIDAIPYPIFYKDASGRYLGCNRAFEQDLGLDRAQMLGKTVYDIAPQDLAEIYHQADKALLEKPGIQIYESSVAYADGSRREVVFNTATFQDAEGKVAGLVGTIIDVTERKRAEEQIRLLADAVQSTREMIYITDQENRLTFANQAFLRGHGYATEEIVGRTPEFLYSDKNPPGLYDVALQQTLRGGWKGDILSHRKDGTEFPISLITSLIKSPEGRTLGLVSVAGDISERIRAEKREVAFAHLGYRLSATSTGEQAADIILDIGSELFGWDAGYVAIYSPEQDQITPLLTVDTVEGERVRLPPTSSPLSTTSMLHRVMQEGAQLVNPTNESRRTLNLIRFGNVDRQPASMMFAPIRAKGAVIGFLSIQSYTPQAYSDEDLQLLQTLADHCGDALERIKVAEALRAAEAKYRNIVENATEGIFQTTPDGRFRSANPALVRMLGYQTPEELMAEVTDLDRQVYVRPEKRQELKRLMETQGSAEGFEFEHYRKDGGVFWASVNGRAVRDTNGALQYYEGTIQDITKRKSAEEALEMSRILQDALLHNIPDPAWLKDAEGRFLACNEPLARLLGQPRHAIAGRTLLDLDPHEAARLIAEDQQVMQAGKPGRFEWRRVDPQGRVGWFETIKSPLLGERGDATGTVGIARDITERKWVENLLRCQRDFSIFLSSTDDLVDAAERLLKIILENEGLDCGVVYLVDSEKNTLDLAAHHGLSAGFHTLCSRVAANLLTSPLAIAGPARSAEPAGPMAVIVEQLKREGLQGLEVVPIQHSGHVVAVLIVGSLIHEGIPKETRHVVEALAAQAGGAITRIRAEQAMRTSRQLLEKTIQSLRDAVFIVDARMTTIQECNPAATRLFGHSREEMIGQSPALLHLNEAMREEFRRHLEAAVKESGLLSDFECTMKRKDGTSFPSEFTLVPLRNEHGQIVTWVGVVRDITERKRTEEGLRQLSRRIVEAQEAERQRVARDLHDSVNQVIASAKMRLRKVEVSVALNPVAKELLARCDELLVQALEENRRIAHDLRPTDLDALGFADACRNFCRQFQARTNLVVKTRLARFAQRCPPATELNLFRIVQESLNNVEKHAHAKTVRLQIAFRPGELRLRIQDDGHGFDPSAVRPARRKGGGIGLTNIRERAAILGGTCEVVSAPNQGTAITVRVPFQDHH